MLTNTLEVFIFQVNSTNVIENKIPLKKIKLQKIEQIGKKWFNLVLFLQNQHRLINAIKLIYRKSIN